MVGLFVYFWTWHVFRINENLRPVHFLEELRRKFFRVEREVLARLLAVVIDGAR